MICRLRKKTEKTRRSLLTDFLFACVVFATHFVQGITGFGGTVLAMPFVIHMVDPRVAIPVLTVLSLLFSLTLALMDRGRIVWREVFVITAHLALGAPFGVLFFRYLPREIYKPAMGTLILIIACWGLLRIVSARAAAINVRMWVKRALLIFGGVTQGAFGSSGPFVILYAEGALKEKSEFRTTLTAMWALINAIVLPQYIIAGTNTAEVMRLSAVSLPAIFLGLGAGMLGHKKIDAGKFSLVIYSVLLVSGLFNLFS